MFQLLNMYFGMQKELQKLKNNSLKKLIITLYL